MAPRNLTGGRRPAGLLLAVLIGLGLLRPASAAEAIVTAQGNNQLDVVDLE